MICEACITKHEFLLHYDSFSMLKPLRTTEDSTVDVTTAPNPNDSEEKGNNVEAETPADCKKPKEKSLKICAKFWPEVSKVLLLNYIIYI